MIEAHPLHQRWEGVPELLKFVCVSSLIVPIAFGQISLTTAQIAKRVSPSVVVIQGKTDSGEVLGSGFIVSKDGNIVTNLHVIRDMKTASVHLANGRTLDSVFVLATDERRDLSIIHISGFDPQKHDGDIFDLILDQIPQRSQVLDLGNSDSVSVGEPVVVLGSPQGLEGTVTAGILSSVRDSGEGFKVLQTDAAVNPGNSGGPLVNNRGQAIGVVSFKLRSAEGLNFAIPINYVRGLLSRLHDPMTLDQMRRILGATSMPNHSTSEPSLKETLEWLKDRILLANVHYGDSVKGQWDVTLKVVPVSFASCTVVFDQIKTQVNHQPKDLVLVTTTRYTLPLGLGIRTGVEQSLPNVRDSRGYRLALSSESAVILEEAHYPDNDTTTDLTAGMPGVPLKVAAPL